MLSSRQAPRIVVPGATLTRRPSISISTLARIAATEGAATTAVAPAREVVAAIAAAAVGFATDPAAGAAAAVGFARDTSSAVRGGSPYKPRRWIADSTAAYAV